MVSDDYLAGLFDGEGSITVIHRDSEHGRRFMTRLCVSVGMKNKTLVNLFAERFGGTVYKHSSQGVWQWCAVGSTAAPALRVFARACIQKSRLAELALDMIALQAETTPARGKRRLGSSIVSDANLAARAALSEAAASAKMAQYTDV